MALNSFLFFELIFIFVDFFISLQPRNLLQNEMHKQQKRNFQVTKSLIQMWTNILISVNSQKLTQMKKNKPQSVLLAVPHSFRYDVANWFSKRNEEDISSSSSLSNRKTTPSSNTKVSAMALADSEKSLTEVTVSITVKSE